MNHANRRRGGLIEQWVLTSLALNGQATALELAIRCDYAASEYGIKQALDRLRGRGLLSRCVLGSAKFPAWTYRIGAAA